MINYLKLNTGWIIVLIMSSNLFGYLKEISEKRKWMPFCLTLYTGSIVIRKTSISKK